MSIQVVILAAGLGKRMHSALPKVLHQLAGKSLLEHVMTTAATVAPLPPMVVYGHQGEQLRQALSHVEVRWVEQTQQLGTAHALMQALPEIADEQRVLVLYGDVPLISPDTLSALIESTPQHAMSMLTATFAQPQGYGRIKRNENGDIIGIVEDKDATPEERAITEINPGIYVVPAVYLKKWLPQLQNHNAQGEYYLTDIITCAVRDNIKIYSIATPQPEEVMGVNDRIQLAQLERFYQRQYANKLMRQGVTLIDPARLDIRGEVHIGRDVTIDVNVILEGRVVIGDHCVIGANCSLRNTLLGKQVMIKPNSILDGAQVAALGVVGPFARLRPGAMLARQAHVGNFVEIKNSVIGEHSKVNHLSYIGDSEIGKQVNIGAGTITCNYDGVNKHKTTIGDNVFIGSNTQLVAPVKIGEGATIGAGSTITEDAPAHQLTLARAKQISVPGWTRPVPSPTKKSDDIQ